MTTKGAFLHEKMTNMAAWLDSELESSAFAERMKNCTYAQATLIAATIKERAEVVQARDFDAFGSMHGIPDEFKDIALQIQTRTDTHDKFWRYLDLFVSVV